MKLGPLMLCTLCALPATAQVAPDLIEGDQIKQEVEGKEKAEARQDGWTHALSLGFNGAYTHSSGVIGNPDGNLVQFGAVLEGEANLLSGQHEWINRLVLAHAQTLTPQIDEWIKTTDNLQLRSMYLYSLKEVPWLGPFARARLETSILEGELIRAETVTLRKVDEDGSTSTEVLPAQEAENTTNPFEPLVLRQSAGLFARPWREETFKLTTTLGLGAQEVIAQGGYAVAGDDEEVDVDGDGTPEIVVPLQQVKSSAQIGVEVEALAEGLVNEQVTWTVFANLLMPFYTSDKVFDVDGEQLEGFDLLNTEIGAKLSVKLAKWASLDYLLSAKRLPVVINEWQVQNSVLLSSAFNLL